MTKKQENINILKRTLELGIKNNTFVDNGKALKEQIDLEEEIQKKIYTKDYIEETEKSEILRNLALKMLDKEIEELKKGL